MNRTATRFLILAPALVGLAVMVWSAMLAGKTVNHGPDAGPPLAERFQK